MVRVRFWGILTLLIISYTNIVFSMHEAGIAGKKRAAESSTSSPRPSSKAKIEPDKTAPVSTNGLSTASDSSSNKSQ